MKQPAKKHEAIIGFERAVCSCGNMQGCWRMQGETIGAFTLRSHEVWEQHATAPLDVRGTLFDFAAPQPAAVMSETLDLFA